jgi:hypothetical protein
MSTDVGCSPETAEGLKRIFDSLENKDAIVAAFIAGKGFRDVTRNARGRSGCDARGERSLPYGHLRGGIRETSVLTGAGPGKTGFSRRPWTNSRESCLCLAAGHPCVRPRDTPVRGPAQRTRHGLPLARCESLEFRTLRKSVP